MGCDICGSQTPRNRLCQQCAIEERAEERARSDDERVRYECPDCGEKRASAPGSTCWLCRSDEHEEGPDGRPRPITDGGRDPLQAAVNYAAVAADAAADTPSGARLRLAERALRQAVITEDDHVRTFVLGEADVHLTQALDDLEGDVSYSVRHALQFVRSVKGGDCPW